VVVPQRRPVSPVEQASSDRTRGEWEGGEVAHHCGRYWLRTGLVRSAPATFLWGDTARQQSDQDVGSTGRVSTRSNWLVGSCLRIAPAAGGLPNA
jgi:hypothetical protein